MKIRAIICDVYNTLMEVGPPPPDADLQWEALCFELLGGTPLPLPEFHARCRAMVEREHAAARDAGIPHPEVYWPALAAGVVPELAMLHPRKRHEFLLRHAALQHSVRLMPGAAGALRQFMREGIVLGIASNAQPYTLGELAMALADGGLGPSLFIPELTFWSFENGYSKPDPHVFRLLSARLRRLGIGPEETLMVGDRLDNDIEPARAHGWRTWRIAPDAASASSGGWEALRRLLSSKK